MSFIPPLGSHTKVTTAGFHPLHFSYTAPDVNEPEVHGRTPEVWTNLTGSWDAIPLLFNSKSGLYLASATLCGLDINDEPLAVEFTYRWRYDDGSLEWLSGAEGNGRIELVRPGTRHGSKFRVGTFELDDGGKSGETQEFSLDSVLEGWEPTEGLVLERSERHWLLPRVLNHPLLESISKLYECQLLILQAGTDYLVLLPFCTASVASSLFLSNDNRLVLRCTRDSSSATKATGKLAVGSGANLHDVVDRCVKLAGEELSPNAVTNLASTLKSKLVVPSSPASVQSPRGITWCTWNALGQDYTLSQVLSSIDSLLTTDTAFGSAIDAVLLDDGWADTRPFDDERATENRKSLWSFGTREGWFDVKGEAEVKRDEELKEAVRLIKAKGVKNVGAWITISGYWAAIHPDSPLAGKFALYPFKLDSTLYAGARMTWNLPSTPQSYIDYLTAYFTSLKESGIGFIKIDDQSDADFLLPSDDLDVGEYRSSMYASTREVAQKIFGIGNVTHCMAGSARLWTGALALVPSASNSGDRDVLRNSDDFFPYIDETHRFHIGYNFRTALLSRSLPGIHPDFDMTQEDHPWGLFHIAARAFQTAPVLSTDLGGTVKSDGAWDGLLAQTVAGPRVLKSSNVGAVLESRAFEDVFAGGVGPALKAGVAVPQAAGGTVGWWNCRAEGAASFDIVVVRDVVEALGRARDPNADYIVYFQDGRKIISVDKADLDLTAGGVVDSKPVTSVRLSQRQVALATIAPVFHLSGISIACVGLLGKYAGLSAISSISIIDRHHQRVVPLVRSPPPPQSSYLAFLVASNVLRQQTGTPKEWTFRSFWGQFWRRPLSTLWVEVSGLIGWALTAALFVLHRSRDQQRSLAGPTETKTDLSAERRPDLALRIQLAFGGRLGFVVPAAEAGRLTIEVDGKQVEWRVTPKASVGDQVVVEVDLETGSLRDRAVEGGGWMVDVVVDVQKDSS